MCIEGGRMHGRDLSCLRGPAGVPEACFPLVGFSESILLCGSPHLYYLKTCKSETSPRRLRKNQLDGNKPPAPPRTQKTIKQSFEYALSQKIVAFHNPPRLSMGDGKTDRQATTKGTTKGRRPFPSLPIPSLPFPPTLPCHQGKAKDGKVYTRPPLSIPRRPAFLASRLEAPVVHHSHDQAIRPHDSHLRP